MAFGLFSQGFGIMLAQLRRFFRREIAFLRCMEVFFHLFYDMLRFTVVLYFQVGRRSDNLVGMPADRAELPFLETIHIGEGPAGRAPDDKVHDKEVMRVILIKIYRLVVITTAMESFWLRETKTGSLIEELSLFHISPPPSENKMRYMSGGYHIFGTQHLNGKNREHMKILIEQF